MEKQGIMFNYDSDNFLHTRREIIDTVDAAYLESFIDQYTGTQVTDFLFCVNALLSAYPSKVFTSYADRYHVTQERGQNVDYTNTCCNSAHVLWEVKKLDMYRIWIDRCRQNGIRPWLSFRMNDAHCMTEPPHFLVPPEKYNHFADHSCIRHRQQIGYFDRCYDYSLEEIRSRMLRYIEEAITRYDVYGIELDFQRELYCFRPGHEDSDRAVMTAFIGQIKALTDRVAQQIGHPIQIAARCHQNPVVCREMGFDVVEWAKQGYIHMYIVAPRWETTDTDMPIALWKQILAPYGVTIAGGLEILTKSHNNAPHVPNSVSSALGAAAGILSQGAEQLYLFNYFDFADQMMAGDHRTFNEEESLSVAEGMYRFLCHAGTLETVRACPRKNLVTYADIAPFWRHIDFQLPCIINDPKLPSEYRCLPSYLRIVTGRIDKHQTADLVLGIQEAFSPDCFDVFINCEKLEFVGEVPHTAPVLTESKLYAFRLPDSVKHFDIKTVELWNRDLANVFTVDYADISIR